MIGIEFGRGSIAWTHNFWVILVFEYSISFSVNLSAQKASPGMQLFFKEKTLFPTSLSSGVLKKSQPNWSNSSLSLSLHPSFSTVCWAINTWDASLFCLLKKTDQSIAKPLINKKTTRITLKWSSGEGRIWMWVFERERERDA